MSKKDDLNIRVDNGILSIQCKVKSLAPGNELYQEYDLPRFWRQFELSDEVDQEKIEAELKYGVLTLKLPKAEKAKQNKLPLRLADLLFRLGQNIWEVMENEELDSCPCSTIVERLCEDINNTFERWFDRSQHQSKSSNELVSIPFSKEFMAPAIDLIEQDDEIIVTAELPGLDKDDFKVEMVATGYRFEGRRNPSRKKRNGITTMPNAVMVHSQDRSPFLTKWKSIKQKLLTRMAS